MFLRYHGSITDVPFSADRTHGSSVSDATGRFVLDEICPRTRYRLDAWTTSGEVATIEIGPFDECSGTFELDPVVLGATASLAGVVRGLELPLQRALIEVMLYQQRVRGALVRRRNSPTVRVRTDAEGAFRADGLPAGVYSVTLVSVFPDQSGAGIAPGSLIVTLDSGEHRHDLVVRRDVLREIWVGGSVMGSDAAPIHRAKVTLYDTDGMSQVASCLTSKDGAFAFERPRTDGEWMVSVEDLGHRYARQDLGPFGFGTEHLRIVLEPYTSSITGFLLDQNAQPVEDAFVAFREEDTGLLLGRVGIPDAKGYFEMEGLRASPYRLELVDFEAKYRPARMGGVCAADSPVEFYVKAARVDTGR